MIENDSPYFRIVPARPVESTPADPNEVARGDGWSIIMNGDVPMLRYQSGEHGGGVRRIAIKPTEVEALKSGQTTLDAVLIANHAS